MPYTALNCTGRGSYTHTLTHQKCPWHTHGPACLLWNICLNLSVSHAHKERCYCQIWNDAAATTDVTVSLRVSHRNHLSPGSVFRRSLIVTLDGFHFGYVSDIVSVSRETSLQVVTLWTSSRPTFKPTFKVRTGEPPCLPPSWFFKKFITLLTSMQKVFQGYWPAVCPLDHCGLQLEPCWLPTGRT